VIVIEIFYSFNYQSKIDTYEIGPSKTHIVFEER